MTFSPLLYQAIWYGGIKYDWNYDGGSSDFPGFVLSQSCISYPHQSQVFVQSNGTFDGEGSHPSHPTPSQDNKDGDEYHQGNGGREWCCSINNR